MGVGPASNCSPNEAAQIGKAVDEMAQQAHECLMKLDSGLALEFDTYVASHDFRIQCGGTTRPVCGTHDYDGSITLFDSSFSNPACSLTGTLFHEILHETGPRSATSAALPPRFANDK